MDSRQIEVMDDAMAEVLRRKTPAERIGIGFGLWRSAQRMLRAHLASTHPDWDEPRSAKKWPRGCRMEHVVETFKRLRIPYFVTGSVASMAYGELRLTNDIDVVAEIRDTHVLDVLAAFPSDAFYLSEEAVPEALVRQGQFNIIHPGSGSKWR